METGIRFNEKNLENIAPSNFDPKTGKNLLIIFQEISRNRL